MEQRSKYAEFGSEWDTLYFNKLTSTPRYRHVQHSSLQNLVTLHTANMRHLAKRAGAVAQCIH
jgi:hypothetical protein